MIEPSLAFRTAVRAALIAAPAIVALVPPERIRAGSTRPDKDACIVIAGDQTAFLGRASGSQLVAQCWLDLHIWAPDGAADRAQAIGAAVAATLFDAPASIGIEIDEWQHPTIRYLPDPAPERAWTHGHVELGAVLRWRV